MSFRFKKHYTVEEARKLLPQVRGWLNEIEPLRLRAVQHDQRLQTLLADGADIGGKTVGDSLRNTARLREVLREFQTREIEIKDLERGLIDFPALKDGQEIFLCWEKDEEDIEHWHSLDGGYAGRERLD